MSETDLTGLGVALITPFKSDGSIDFGALEKLIEYQIENGSRYIVCLGTTAETPTLSDSEREAIVRFMVEKVRKRVPIVMGVGGNNTVALRETLTSFDFSGISAILSVTPYYNKPSQEGLFRHYSVLSEASPLPLILYNVPGRTGVNLSAETTLRVARACQNVIGIKEASGDIAQVKKIIDGKTDDFLVISGDDAMTLPIIQNGGNGVISVLANAFPKLFSELVVAALNGDEQFIQSHEKAFENTFKLLFKDGNPAGVKCYLSLMGLIENELRLPLVPVCDETRNNILSDLKTLTP